MRAASAADAIARMRPPAVPAAGARPQLRMGATPFVGRQRELAEIQTAMAGVPAGAGRVVLLFGEAGSGKTRLASEAIAIARGSGWATMLGRCPEGESIPVFSPWIQALRDLVENPQHASAIARTLDEVAGELRRLLPTLRADRPELALPSGLDPGCDRHRLFDAIGRLLQAVAARAPLLLVIEDLHAADGDSLHVLRFVAREIAQSRVLIVGTYRDAEIEPGHPFSSVLTDLLREPGVAHLPILDLSEAAVGEFIALATGLVPEPRVVDDVFRRTDGNALFVNEVVRLLIAEGALERADLRQESVARVPPGVREVLRRRMAILSPPARDVLAVGALLGREFELGPLERMTGRPQQELLAVLDEAIRAGMLSSRPEAPFRFRISHALVRDTIYADLAASRRAELHKRAGELLEDSLASSDPFEPPYAELGYHFQRSSSDAAQTKAYRYSLLAARHAATHLAFDEATQLFQRAIALQQQAAPRDATDALCDLLVELGDAAASAGQPDVARASYERAAAAAERADLPIVLARAAIGMSGPLLRFGKVDHAAIARLEAALRRLPVAARELRARALIRLAIELQGTTTPARRAALADASEVLAKECGDVRTLCEVVAERRSRLRRTDSPVERMAAADDLICRAQHADDIAAELEGRAWRIQDLLELGDIVRVRDDMASFADRAFRLRVPLYTHRAIAHEVIRATLEGRFAEAERRAATFYAVARQVSDWQAASAFFGQTFILRRLRGDLESILSPVREFIDQHPDMPILRAGLAVGLLDVGREHEAAREYESVIAGGLAKIPEDAFWFGTVALLAEVASHLGDRSRIALLRETLLPFEQRNVSFGYGGCLGPTTRVLALLAAAVEDWRAAERSFDAALRAADRLEAPPYTVVIRKDLAAMLLRRNGEGDRGRALALLETAERAAQRLDMAKTLAEIQRERAAASDVARAPSRETPRPSSPDAGVVRRRASAAEPRGVIFRREGEYWSIGACDAPFHLRDSVGLRCVALLLARPGEQLLALDLAGVASAGGSDGARGWTRSAGPSTEPLLDERATASSRARLAELRDRCEEARERGDEFAECTLRDEIERLATELSRALGLHGRSRQAGSPAERARVNVTRTIGEAIRRIAANDAALARHLRAGIRTGTYCAYQPADPNRVDWNL